MLETLLTVAGTLAGSILLFIIGYLTYRNTRKKDREQAVISKEANAIDFSGKLLERLTAVEKNVTTLEGEVKTLRKDLNEVTELFRTAINFTEAVMLSVIRGYQMPRVPLALRKYFDAALLDEHERKQKTPKE